MIKLGVLIFPRTLQQELATNGRRDCRKGTFFTLEWKPQGRKWSALSVYTSNQGTSLTNKRNLRERLTSKRTNGLSHTIDRLLFPNTQYGLNGRCIRVVVKEVSYLSVCLNVNVSIHTMTARTFRKKPDTCVAMYECVCACSSVYACMYL